MPKPFIPRTESQKNQRDPVHINHSRDHVAKAPRYDPKLVDDNTYYSSIYGYYGYMPFWGTSSGNLTYGGL